MSDTVENRVVEMRFDNKDFEMHASESIKTLGDLDKALEFKNSGRLKTKHGAIHIKEYQLPKSLYQKYFNIGRVRFVKEYF